jgi:hypothetical protein
MNYSSEYTTLLENIEQRIIFFAVIFINFPGILMNAFNLILFNIYSSSFQRNLRFYSTCQSLIDASSLTLCLLVLFPKQYGVDLTSTSDFACKFLFIATRFTVQSSSWMQVLLAFDRVFCTLFNSKYKLIFGSKYLWGSAIFVLSLIIMSSLTNMAFYIQDFSFNINNQTILRRFCMFDNRFGLFVNFMGFKMRMIIPFCLMIFFNLILIHKVFLPKNQIIKLSKRESNLAFSIVSINFTFLLLNLPLAVQQLCEYLPNTSSPERKAFMSLWQRIGSFIMYSFQAYSFIFYLKFNSIFRKEAFRFAKIFLSQTVQ